LLFSVKELGKGGLQRNMLQEEGERIMWWKVKVWRLKVHRRSTEIEKCMKEEKLWNILEYNE
jgi:hypothetical protein